MLNVAPKLFLSFGQLQIEEVFSLDKLESI